MYNSFAECNEGKFLVLIYDLKTKEVVQLNVFIQVE